MKRCFGPQSSRRGFTLIEVLLALSISAVILVLAGMMLRVSLVAYQDRVKKDQTASDAGYAWSLIRDECDRAMAVYDIKYDGHFPKNNLGFLFLAPAYDGAGVVYTGYYVKNGQLYRGACNRRFPVKDMTFVRLSEGESLLSEDVLADEGSFVDLKNSVIQIRWRTKTGVMERMYTIHLKQLNP